MWLGATSYLPWPRRQFSRDGAKASIHKHASQLLKPSARCTHLPFRRERPALQWEKEVESFLLARSAGRSTKCAARGTRGVCQRREEMVAEHVVIHWTSYARWPGQGNRSLHSRCVSPSRPVVMLASSKLLDSNRGTKLRGIFHIRRYRSRVKTTAFVCLTPLALHAFVPDRVPD